MPSARIASDPAQPASWSLHDEEPQVLLADRTPAASRRAGMLVRYLLQRVARGARSTPSSPEWPQKGCRSQTRSGEWPEDRPPGPSLQPRLLREAKPLTG